MARNDKTKYDILYDEFDYKGHKSHYFYDIPFDDFVEGIREYFNQNLVTIDGTDNAIWNSFVGVEDFMDFIVNEMEEWFKDRCKDDAFEEYKEKVEEDIELENELKELGY